MAMTRAIAFAAVLALAASTASAQDDAKDRGKGGLGVGDVVKELKLKTLDGKEITLGSLRKGTVLVLNYWGAG